MPTPGQLRGVYNIVEKDAYETVPNQLSVEIFLDNLESDTIPKEVTIVNLEDKYEEETFISELSRTMDRRADDLENADPSPMIQFAVDAAIHRGDPAFDLFYEGEVYPLAKVFGRQLQSRVDDHAWLTAPF